MLGNNPSHCVSMTNKPFCVCAVLLLCATVSFVCICVCVHACFPLPALYIYIVPVSVCHLCVCFCVQYVFISHSLSVCVCVSGHLFSVGSGPDSQGFVFLSVFWDQEDRYVPELLLRCTVPYPHCLLVGPICQWWFEKGKLFWNPSWCHPHRHWGVSSLKLRSITNFS